MRKQTYLNNYSKIKTEFHTMHYLQDSMEKKQRQTIQCSVGQTT